MTGTKMVLYKFCTTCYTAVRQPISGGEDGRRLKPSGKLISSVNGVLAGVFEFLGKSHAYHTADLGISTAWISPATDIFYSGHIGYS